ncbi:thiamine diphosphokinase [Mucilaginibacter psychrotolerans]|uniref:Thiamine diphosphokinase n=1 Tax=Mucilaginibacter psychrotolerans TaxID=1524096 RepID=A0A4Y8SMU6_9SPHI|nr:thiamine diphosphokinase [Mucilaginibacter psychrotolerans]TFF40369.1 thiamine diphosphokinase [Mucilaginibacter psychrotolerans]
MSSHHIVREKQEPALLALGLNTFDPELLGQLLEWSPTVICTPATAEQINAYGIKIDILVADEPETGLQSDVKLIPTGNGDAIKAALDYLIDAGYSAVNIITDDFVLDNFEAYADKINLVIFCGDKKIFPVMSGFKKWKPAGEVIELLSPSIGVKTEGLTPVGDGGYQTTNDGFYCLQFEEAFLFVAERV